MHEEPWLGVSLKNVRTPESCMFVGFLDEFPEVRKAKIHKNRTLMLCLSQYSSQILLQV